MTTITIKEYFDDYSVGDVGESIGRTVSEADIHQYAGITGDWNPLHTDAEFAKKSMFGERIAHGPLVFSLINGLCVQIPYSLPTFFIAAYGIDRMRFTAPTKIGDTLRAEAKVIKLDAKDDNYGVVTSEIKGFNQHGEVVCSYEAKMAVQRRPKA